MTLTVRIDSDRVSFGDRLFVRFERTLRIPDDGRTYPLPPSLGAFPVRRVDDYLDRVPEAWRAKGGVFLPVHSREAMWLSFQGSEPTALKVAVGKVCALTGETYREGLSREDQNYLVAPNQPWLDGICVKKGVIRQFVAVPLGLGATVEGQVTGEEKHGGVQLVAYAPKPGRIPKPIAPSPGPSAPAMPGSILFSAAPAPLGGAPMPPPSCAPAPACAPPSMQGPSAPAFASAPGASAPVAPRARAATTMGLGGGGRMEQAIYKDPYGAKVWDEESAARCFVHMVSPEDFAAITGEPVPASPADARAYANAGFPFFELQDEHVPSLEGSSVLAKVKSVQALVPPKDPSEDASFEPKTIKTLGEKILGLVRDGTW